LLTFWDKEGEFFFSLHFGTKGVY